MIRLGDVNFNLGADTRNLQSSVQTLNAFGRTVDQVASNTNKAARTVEAAMRRQEKAVTDAFNRTLALNQQMRKTQGTETFANQAASAFRNLNNVMTNGAMSALQYQRAMEQFKASIGNVQRGFRDHAVAQKGAQGANKNFIEALQDLSNGLVLIQGPLGGFATRMASITALMKRGGWEVAAFVGGLAAGGLTAYKFGDTVLDAGKKMNSFLSQLTAVSGSTTVAQHEMGSIIDIARRTGVSIEALAPAYAKFNVAAEGTGITAKQTSEAFYTVAAASAKLQLDTETTAGVFKALEQIMSKGTVQAEELRGQLGDRLPGAFQMAARAMGVTTAKLGEMMKKGEVLSADFMPKFIAEMQKTFNITTAPIDNYTAALNNQGNAWFQLRAELDKQLGVTEKVIAFYKATTRVLDGVRENLDKIKIAAALVGSALLGMIAPGVISGFVTLIAWMGRATMSMMTFNAVTLANPLIRFGAMMARLAIVIGAVGLATYKYGSNLKVINGEMATVGDYSAVVWNKMKQGSESTFNQIRAGFGTLVIAGGVALESLGVKNKTTWQDIKDSTYNGTNTLLNIIANLADVTPTILATIPSAVGLLTAQAMNKMIDLIEEALNWVNHKVIDMFNVFKFENAPDWIKKGLGLEALTGPLDRNTLDVKLGRLDTSGFEEDLRKMDELNKDFEARLLKKRDVLGDWRNAANARANGRMQPNSPDRTKDDYVAPVDVAPMVQETELTEKQVKALEKKFQAMQDITDEITRTREEIVALGSDQATLNNLTAEFKRQDEVEKYAKAMRKAGVDTEYVTKATAELYDLLAKRDELKKAQEGLMNFRDTLASAFDSVGQSIVDAMFSGENAAESLANVFESVVKDILKSYAQLAWINPLKNWLLGTDEPTLQGGLLKNLGSVFGGGSRDKAASTVAQSADVWGGLRDVFSSSAASKIAQPTASSFDFAGLTKTGIKLSSVSTQGLVAKVSAQYADRFDGLFKDLTAAGYKINSLGEGGYSYRNVAGSTNLSKHSFGEAVDINPRSNPWSHIFKTDMPSNVNDIAKKNGLTWGGTWNKPDTMHFQVDKSVEKTAVAMNKATSATNSLAQSANTSASGLGDLGKGLSSVSTSLMTSAQNMLSAQGGMGGGGWLAGLANMFGGLGGAMNFMTGISPGITGVIMGGGGGLFAKGSAFKNGMPVVTRKTHFPMANGKMGTMGEKGPEAIMPLTRDQHGKLGISMVQAPAMSKPMQVDQAYSGYVAREASQAGTSAYTPSYTPTTGNGSTSQDRGGTKVRIYNNVAKDAQIEVKETKNSRGEQMIDVVVSKIFKKIARGDADPMFATRYNLLPPANRRG